MLLRKVNQNNQDGGEQEQGAISAEWSGKAFLRWKTLFKQRLKGRIDRSMYLCRGRHFRESEKKVPRAYGAGRLAWHFPRREMKVEQLEKDEPGVKPRETRMEIGKPVRSHLAIILMSGGFNYHDKKWWDSGYFEGEAFYVLMGWSGVKEKVKNDEAFGKQKNRVDIY